MTRKVDTSEPSKINTSPPKPWWKRGLRLLGWVGSLLVILLVLLLLFIRSPWGQELIIGKATQYLSSKTHTEVSIDAFTITFSGKINIEGLYIEDLQGDTLIYSRQLKAGIPIWPIIQGEPISINRVEWRGLRVNISRKDTVDGFNYQFLIDAFASDTAATQLESPSSEPLKIDIGRVEFSDFRVNYVDAVTGMKVHLRLGHFYFQGEDFNLQKMKFEVHRIALKNTRLSYIQTKPMPPSPKPDSTSATPLPFLSVDKLLLKNVALHYQSIPAGVNVHAKLGDFVLQLPKADLARQTIRVKQIALKNSTIRVETPPAQKTKEKTTSPNHTTGVPFAWPNWMVIVNQINLDNNHLIYRQGNKPTGSKGLNLSFINLKDVTLKVDQIKLTKEKTLKAALAGFSFQNMNGPDLKQFNFLLQLNNRQLQVKSIDVRAGHSLLSANFNVRYNSLDAFVAHPEQSSITAAIEQVAIDFNDLFRLVPDLKQNEYLKNLSRHMLTGSVKMKGTMATMRLSKFVFRWGDQTAVKAHGQFKHLMHPDSLWLAVEQFHAETSRKALMQLLPQDSLNISIPHSMALGGQFNGTLHDFTTTLKLATSAGGIQLSGRYHNNNRITFDATLEIDSLKLGKILKNPVIGPLALTLQASGHGPSLNELTAELHSEIKRLKLNGYDYSALQLSGNWMSDTGHIMIAFKDQHLNLDLRSTLKIEPEAKKIALNLKLHSADLKALGLAQRKIKTQMKLAANVKIKPELTDLKAQIDEAVIVYGGEAYRPNDANLSALLLKDSTLVNVSSGFLNMKLRSNAEVAQITSAIEQQLKHYFVDSTSTSRRAKNPVHLELNLNFHPNTLISEVFMPSIQRMDTLELGVHFNQRKHLLTASIYLSHLNYGGNIIRDFGFKITSTPEAAQFSIGFEELDAAAFTMNTTYLNGQLKDGALMVQFNSVNDKGKPFYAIQAQISQAGKHLKIHIASRPLIKGARWHVPEENYLIIKKDQILAHHFIFTRQNQRVKVANDLVPLEQNNIGIGFQNFSLANVMALFNSKAPLAGGVLQGRFIAVNPLGRLGFLADLQIDSLQALQTPLGDLTLQAVSKQANHYRFRMKLKGDDVDLGIEGNYIAAGNPHFNLKLNINRLGLKTIDQLAGAKLQDGTGFLSAQLTAQGPVRSPRYEGFIQFHDASFTLAPLNTPFYLANDKITFNNAGIRFNHFSIEDANHHSLTIDGFISTENMTNPAFDLTISANNFQLMHSTSKTDLNYYGTINFDVNGTITGTMNFPRVDLNVGVNESTNFTYVLTSSQAAMKKREGIVEFVNKARTENMLSPDERKVNTATVTGLQLHTRLHIDNEATFRVIVSPRTGDNFKISGEGSLDFNIARNGRMTLTGRYTVRNGYYKLTLFNIVERKFYLQEGSTVTWSGDPMGAELDVTAVYKVKTSASGLMAAQLAGASSAEQSKYKQVLPFWVLMHINGTIKRPKIQFGLTMPERSQGALGGAVYARVRQLGENPSALNKQVFSLLVLNRFYPVPGSDGSSGGVAKIARNNLNRLLSDQLNAFANRLLGDTGFQLNFGLQSYTDYGGSSAQRRTDLNITAKKTLFNDRLVVKAGTDVNVQGKARPGEETALLGNVSIIYLLTKDGRWRLRGFRKNSYENIIDGQVFVNGLALAFQYQFNKFHELWQNIFGVEKEQKGSAGVPASRSVGSPENRAVKTEETQ